MKNTAIILAGAVAKGSYESGVLKVITKNPNINIKTIVATSSGALNATALAAGITSGKVAQAMDSLVSTWINHGSWHNILEFNLSGIINRQGISNSDRLRRLIKITVEKFVTADLNPIELKIVMTQLSGHTGFINGRPNTTFEAVANFNQTDFYNSTKREAIYTAACASAAFPGLFAPVNVPGFGACYDGGLVNDTPIKYALESHIDRIIVISPFPALSASPDNFKGLDLASRFGDVIVNERLYRDLLNADKVNSIVKKINNMKDAKELSEDQFKKLEAILDHKKEVEIVQIRPKKRLDGNGFSGLFDKSLREAYIEEGIRTAEETAL